MRVTRGEVFKRVQALRPGRSVFDLSYSKKMSGVMGKLYPMMCDEVVPGDVFEIGVDAVVRFAPMVAPPLHEIYMKADWYFVPYRLLGDRTVDENGATAWERFITGGQEGALVNRSTLGLLDMNTAPISVGSLEDHLGFPTGVTLATQYGADSPLGFPTQAYFLIWNEYYRDPNFEDPVDIASANVTVNQCKTANWDPDYFTRALPYQQRGTAPALPVSGTTSAEFAAVQASNSFNMSGGGAGLPYSAFNASTKSVLDNNTVDLSGATTVNISEIRTAFQLQIWLERNARSGYRYTEFLRSHFGESPRDDRLDRPEYIGGIRRPVMISEVLQTSETDTSPQGNLAGHGIIAASDYVAKYHAKEYGLIMCIMSIQPRPAYQQGINRQWLRQTRYDFYHPEFANLSEQGIYNQEIYLSASEATNRTIWGYQGRYDEMRVKHDIVSGEFRNTLDFWHLGRVFGSLPALNSTFGHVDPASCTRIFADEANDHLYVHWGNKLKAIRPLPLQSNPGRLDHSYGGV